MTTYIWPEGGGGGLDRFAPKYLVGNVPAGDSAVAYSTDGFVYIPDPGDGSGIAAALTGPDGPGDVYIRPGLYDLGLGTEPVPLVILANTRVQGAGGSTIIRSKADPLSQQVFEFAPDTGGASNATLRDLRIETNGASGFNGVTDYALVAVRGGGSTITNVNFALATQAGTVGLRHALTYDTGGASSIPQHTLESVAISAELATTPGANPTTLVYVREGIVSARTITTYGGDIPFEVYNQNPDPTSGGAVLFGQDLLCILFADTGAWFHQVAAPGNAQGGAMRLTTALFVGNFIGGSPYGVRLEGGSLHVIRNAFFNFVQTGVAVNPPVGVTASGQLSSSKIIALTKGVEIGAGVGGVVGFGVTDCEITAPEYGVDVQNALTREITVTGNTITTGIITGSLPLRIVDAVNTVPSGNVITHADGAQTTSSIAIANAEHCTCTDNVIVSDGVFGITVDASSNYATISGNDVTMNAAPSSACYRVESARNVVQGNIAHVDAGGASACVGIDVSGTASLSTVIGNTVEVETGIGISLAGVKITCNGNTMGVDTSPTAAIDVTGNNNVVIGNFCGTTPPVNDTGLGNEVAHNI